jgi:hypothetical protein
MDSGERMKQAVFRERNKSYYRVLHVPIWLWVFWVLPGNLTSDLFAHGPDRRHWIWLSLVIAGCAWRGYVGRLPGCEPQPYIRFYGIEQPNLWYRVVCYTAAWIDALVPFTLNMLGMIIAVVSGKWMVQRLYGWLYYPLAVAVVLATALDWTPRAKRSTKYEGEERAWFYGALWTIVPAQIAGWAMWRIGGQMSFSPHELAVARLTMTTLVAIVMLGLAVRQKLPRTQRYRPDGTVPAAAGA